MSVAEPAQFHVCCVVCWQGKDHLSSLLLLPPEVGWRAGLGGVTSIGELSLPFACCHTQGSRTYASSGQHRETDPDGGGARPEGVSVGELVLPLVCHVAVSLAFCHLGQVGDLALGS